MTLAAHAETTPIEAPAAPSVVSEDAMKGGWYAVFVMALVVMLAQIDRNVISLMVQPMKRDLGLSDTQVSLLIGLAFSVTYTLVGPPVSRIADRGFRRPVVAASLAIWSCATAACGLAQNFWQLFLGRAVVGGAESASSPASLSMIADVIPRHKLPRAYAIYNAGFIGGGALALTLGGLLLGALRHMEPIHVPGIGLIRDWQIVFIVLGLPGLLVSLLIMLTVPEPQRRSGHKAEGYPLREVLRFLVANRAMHLPMLCGVLLNSMQAFGAAAWVPAFYERTYGWGPAVAGPLLGPINMASALAGLFFGAWLAERLAKRRDDANLRVMFLANFLSIPFMVIQPLMPSPWLALSLSAVGGAIAAMGGAGYNSALQLSTPNAMRGQINALYLFCIAAIGGTLGPLFIALLTDFVAGKEEDLRYVLVGFRALFAPLDCFLIWLAVRPYGKAFRARIEAGD
ncbi:MFS transporter [Sphingobium nicotianae]|uniref:MFS transporter n=1 Tax=Sphingobium nicotianae TaxID=2782607 RepID=A0A9X1DC31_9SPHN|nr:MFS transporter [Sphingobium nicotianae]MBT2187345.1 MFS transporter [Sphingobium nicotianae]